MTTPPELEATTTDLSAMTGTTVSGAHAPNPPALDARAGWYGDPGSGRRYWDGARWWSPAARYFNIGFFIYMLVVLPLTHLR